MNWTQEQLEQLYQEVNRKVAEDPAFREAFQADAKAAMEKIAGRELPEGFTLKLIERDGKYAAAFVVPDFAQGEVDHRELTSSELDEVNAGISFFLIISFCAAAVSVGPCGADGCGANACTGNVCAANLCAADACGGNACSANADATGACAGNACAGDGCGANAGCAGYAAKGAPCGAFVGCKGYTGS